ncbi:hypothetical protein [Nocardioides convexus]|uniref:hypothetical protein n=1 Tax=Nocardioides convexus TaxID=2712224 RepID=UPI0024183CA6|nr:hypothetical protein [Nocardioides convexus]
MHTAVDGYCQIIESWGKPHRLTQEPPVLMVAGLARVPTSDRWVIQGITWGTYLMGPAAGTNGHRSTRRVYQEFSLQARALHGAESHPWPCSARQAADQGDQGDEVDQEEQEVTFDPLSVLDELELVNAGRRRGQTLDIVQALVGPPELSLTTDGASTLKLTVADHQRKPPAVPLPQRALLGRRRRRPLRARRPQQVRSQPDPHLRGRDRRSASPAHQASVRPGRHRHPPAVRYPARPRGRRPLPGRPHPQAQGPHGAQAVSGWEEDQLVGDPRIRHRRAHPLAPVLQRQANSSSAGTTGSPPACHRSRCAKASPACSRSTSTSTSGSAHRRPRQSSTPRLFSVLPGHPALLGDVGPANGLWVVSGVNRKAHQPPRRRRPDPRHSRARRAQAQARHQGPQRQTGSRRQRLRPRPWWQGRRRPIGQRRPRADGQLRAQAEGQALRVGRQRAQRLRLLRARAGSHAGRRQHPREALAVAVADLRVARKDDRSARRAPYPRRTALPDRRR